MKIAVVTFEGFNEIDSFVAFKILNLIKRPDWIAQIVAPTETVTSANGVTIQAQKPLSFANEADVVLFGSGILTRKMVGDEKLMASFQLAPQRQLIGSQCSGALVLNRLGLLENRPVCTDVTTRPWLEEAGVEVLDKPFFAKGNVATAGGCLSSQYLAAWAILKTAGKQEMIEAMRYVAPVGEEDSLVNHILEVVATKEILAPEAVPA